MGLAQDLLDLCQDTISWNRLQSRDSYGDPTFVFVCAYPARLVRKNKLVRNKDAQQVVSSAQCWILPSLTSGDPWPNIQAHDQVKLSDNSVPQILSVEIVQDELEGQTGNPAYTMVNFL